MISKLKDLIYRHERIIIPSAFVAGFIVDTLTLDRVDVWFENVVLLSHLIIIGTMIAAYHYASSRYFKGTRTHLIYRAAPIIMQFSVGALFSAFVVLYTKSASFATSFLFLAILASIFIGNEFLRKKYRKLLVHLGIYFIAVFSYFMLIVPTLLGKIGEGVFLLSGAVSLSVMAIFIYVLYRFFPVRIVYSRFKIASVIGGIYMLITLLYFTNVIPPIPLSLKHIGVYHSVEKVGNQYETSYEPAPWYSFFTSTDNTYRRRSGEPVYVMSSVFAPTKLEADIYHRWLYYDKETKTWREESVIGYPIVGGRDGGYRGYTKKQRVFEGKWRVDVVTETGQVVGVVKFDIVNGEPGKLIEKIR